MRVPPLLLFAGFLCFGATVGWSQNKAKEEYIGHLSLVRYDMPRGLSDGFAPTRQLAVRKLDGPDAVDWVDLTLDGKPLFRDGAEEKLPLSLRKGQEAMSYFQVPADNVVEPGNHWLRAMEWRGGRRHIYTADGAARTANSNASSFGRYELWTFPLQISSEGAPSVKNVSVKYGGRVIYKKLGPWRSLTLLLPANEPGRQYELSVDGRATLRFDIGLMPVKLGAPREQLFQVDATLPGTPAIKVKALSRPERFPNRKEWNGAVASLGKPLSKGTHPLEMAGASGWLGIRAPRSPVTTYAMALPHGKSGGFYGQKGRAFNGTAEEYAAHLSGLGFDLVFDPVNVIGDSAAADSLEERANELAKRGIRFGFQYDNSWNRPSLQHPNLAFLAHTLSDWHAPLYRSLSLTAQRFARFPNFAGISIGSDQAGYGPHWYWLPPAPARPWGEAMRAFAGATDLKIPHAASLGATKFSFQRTAESTDEFIRYISRHESTFRQYGYFAEAIGDVSPDLIFTTGSFGSAPAAGARGGWPWASVPGRVMFEGVPVQQAYDANETCAAKPLHLVSLIDRLRSYAPRKQTWALLDNFQYLYGREAYQRAVAMVLTRGVQGFGTNFLPVSAPDGGHSEAGGYVREMNEWIRRYGGVIARTEPRPVIGIFYGHHQALLRPVIGGEKPSVSDLLKGSHEGKVAETLFLCHAAGWPARVITYQELMREPLPASMKAILLVGLEKFDNSWHWAPGLEKPLRQFQDRGGRILADDSSFCPVKCERPGLNVAAYVAQSNLDASPQLLARNIANIAKLRAVMKDVHLPIAEAMDQDTWVIPAECGDVQYFTVLNQAFASDEETMDLVRASTKDPKKADVWKRKGNASVWVEPRSATLEWRTDRPIYDVSLGTQLKREDATRADLTKDAFRWYALPPREISGVELVVQTETRGGGNPFYEAVVKISGKSPIRGVPVRVTLSRGTEKSEVFGATGWPIRLPITLADEGAWKIIATELLSGFSADVNVAPRGTVPSPTPRNLVQSADPNAISRFAARKHVALTIALTPQQAKQRGVQQQAKALEAYYRHRGRVVSLGRLAPGGVVESLQPLRSPHRYPEWKTIASDLILFGTPSNNVLIQDQAHARLLPPAGLSPKESEAVLAYIRSAFVGEYDVLNILAADEAGLANAVKTLTAAGTGD